MTREAYSFPDDSEYRAWAAWHTVPLGDGTRLIRVGDKFYRQTHTPAGWNGEVIQRGTWDDETRSGEYAPYSFASEEDYGSWDKTRPLPAEGDVRFVQIGDKFYRQRYDGSTWSREALQQNRWDYAQDRLRHEHEFGRDTIAPDGDPLVGNRAPGMRASWFQRRANTLVLPDPEVSLFDNPPLSSSDAPFPKAWGDEEDAHVSSLVYEATLPASMVNPVDALGEDGWRRMVLSDIEHGGADALAEFRFGWDATMSPARKAKMLSDVAFAREMTAIAEAAANDAKPLVDPDEYAELVRTRRARR